jgi:hypothetical protein
MADEVEVLCGLPVHPAAAVFPMIEGTELEELKQSIRKSGLLHPVVVHNGMVIDGRNRLAAWADIYRERMVWQADGSMAERPTTIEWMPADGDSVADYVLRANVHRRQLTPDQRAAAVVRLAEVVERESADSAKKSQFKQGNNAASKTARSKKTEPKQRDHKAEASRTTVAKLAKQASVSPSRVKRAKSVKAKEAAGELPAGTLQSVADGKVELRAVEKPTPKLAPEPKVASEEADAMRALVAKEWGRVKQRFAVAEWPLVRRLMLEIVKDERKEMKD